MRPIVIDNGHLRQLREDDVLTGVVHSKILNYYGNITPTLGTARWYPNNEITIVKVYATIGVVSPTDIKIQVKKNGQSILGYDVITLSANFFKSNPILLNAIVTEQDYLTVDIVSGTGGANLNITLVYT